jgi:hypothetical protein
MYGYAASPIAFRDTVILPVGGPGKAVVAFKQTDGTVVWSLGNAIYFTSGGKGSQPILTAIDVSNGNILWQERSIEKATFVWADDKLLTLDGSGTLMIAHPSPKEFRITARAALLTSLAWTPPTLVGTRAYIRDRKEMVAVDLGA